MTVLISSKHIDEKVLRAFEFSASLAVPVTGISVDIYRLKITHSLEGGVWAEVRLRLSIPGETPRTMLFGGEIAAGEAGPAIQCDWAVAGPEGVTVAEIAKALGIT
ncbi:hypothetical protein [Streptomyces sp. NPDC037389]|uniref:hypothetical protein n=1 Tax=Streptomyces sp. NPDC037389 TaxID=3155369 RepID=UPI0033D45719